MSLMVSYGGELIRHNPSNGHIEYSANHSITWSMRNSRSVTGQVCCITAYGSELLACSDKGVFYSSNKGVTWSMRSSMHRDFIDIQDCGREILASTTDGHVYYSTNKGITWSRRR